MAEALLNSYYSFFVAMLFLSLVGAAVFAGLDAWRQHAGTRRPALQH